MSLELIIAAILTVVVILLIVFLVFKPQRLHQRRPQRSSSPALTSGSWLDHPYCEQYLTSLEQQFPGPRDPAWGQCRMWLLSSQANAAIVAEQAPPLTADLEDLLQSLFSLSQPILSGHTASQLAQQRLEYSHNYLQNLRNRLLLPPDTQITLGDLSNTTLQAQVRELTAANTYPSSTSDE
ncbi:MAG: hypothetical protein OHK0012_01740 [Synechococcales cyanobacterium]